MAHRYLNSACTGATDPYTTPATAATSLAQLLGTGTAINSATDIIYVLDSHSEPSMTSGASLTVTSPSTDPRYPQRVLCVTDLSNPTTLSTGAYFASDEAYSVNFSGSWYIYGVTLHPNNTSNNCILNYINGSAGPYNGVLDNCTFRSRPANGQTSSPHFFVATTGSAPDPTIIRLNDCKLWNEQSGVTSMMQVNGNCDMVIDGLSWDANSSVPPAVIKFWNNAYGSVTLQNSDLSSKSLGYLYTVAGFSGMTFTVKNVKLPSGCLMINPANVSAGFGTKHRCINTDSGDTYTKYSEGDGRLGEWSLQTSIYATTDPADLSSAASDSFSIQMTTTANVSRFLPVYSPWMHVWNDGSTFTPGIEVLVGGDGASALNNDELWMEIDYNSGADSPLGTNITTLPGIIESASTVSAGTTSWTGDGYTTERTHKLSVASITPDKPGWVYFRVALAKPSTTIYVNPPR